MKNRSIPSPAVTRLSLYLRELEHLQAAEVAKVSSSQLAGSLHITDAQVRKDLGYFGQFGRPGVGYRVEPLIEALRHILGTDRTQNVVVIGAGDLGRALLRYRGFHKKGFDIVAAFDISASKVGKQVGHVKVMDMSDLPAIAGKYDVKLAVIAVPTESAQQVTDALCSAGIKGILNFAPAILETTPDVAVRPVDLAASLEQLSFTIASSE